MDLWKFPDEMFYDTIDYGYYKCYKNKDKIIQISIYIYIYTFICIEDTNYRSATKSSLIDKLYEINNSYDKINLQKLKRWQLKDMIKYF